MISARSSDRIARFILWTSGFSVLAILFLIVGYILRDGLRMISFEFLFESPYWYRDPVWGLRLGGGIFSTIVSSLWLVAIGLAVATPVGVGGAIYLAEYTSDSFIARAIRLGVEFLAGVPSIVMGLFGSAVFVIFFGLGMSVLAGGLTVACVNLPIIIRSTEESIRAVPYTYREGSLALGATKWQTISGVVLKSAAPGILTGVILGMGRIIGETAAIMLTVGTAINLPLTLFDGGRPMSFHLYVMAIEAISLEMTFGIASVLIIITLILSLSIRGVASYYTKSSR
ncbi:MAG TPA: phosphate ABC transporter permease PstA [Candidatus Limnocylindrales bacterium]|nr:phosphate ABC transporter permease PstA [Candidatus Limnocylindrales bacterium]